MQEAEKLLGHYPNGIGDLHYYYIKALERLGNLQNREPRSPRRRQPEPCLTVTRVERGFVVRHPDGKPVLAQAVFLDSEPVKVLEHIEGILFDKE